MANRIKVVFIVIISLNQSAFVKGGMTIGNILITYEVLRFIKTSKAKDHHLALKIDIRKACD